MASISSNSSESSTICTGAEEVKALKKTKTKNPEKTASRIVGKDRGGQGNMTVVLPSSHCFQV